MKRNLPFIFMIITALGILMVPMWVDNSNRKAKIARDGCPAVSTRVGWLGKTLIVTGHSGTAGIVYAKQEGYYGSITVSCGSLKILIDVEK